MNITRESTGDLTATIHMEIVPEDYQETVTKALKDYQRKANIPGFRPGKVPFGMVKKMYGKAVMADEVNKLLSDRLSGYMQDEKLEILGNPLPNKEKTKPAQFEDSETFEFFFDIGLAPEITKDIGTDIEVENYVIKIDDKMVDGYIDDTRKRSGNPVHPEISGEEDMISGDLTEIGEDGNPTKGGQQKEVNFILEKITDEKVKKKLMSLKKDEIFVIKPVEFFGTAEEAVQQLKLPAATFENPDLTLSIKVKEITHMEPAELNVELFTKVYPGENIETEEDFRERVKQDAAASFTGETDKFLFQEIIKKLTENKEISLPDEFLKRWLLDHDENKLSQEEIEKQFPDFATSMKWQLIENKLIKDHNIEVTDEEIRGYIRTHLLRQVSQEFADPEMMKKYDSIVDAFMQNKEQVKQINDQLYNAKLMSLFREKLTLKPVEVTYEEFIKLVSAKHEHDHDHEHNHDH
ncbi:MAG: trigger factor [Bacteroidetes bacterium]|nr:trigger factor [Bacteroidota bacterium]